MKKLIAFVLALVIILGMVGCAGKMYELPQDQFCYSAYGTQNYELSADDRQYIIALLNSVSWVNGRSKCESDFVFYTQKQKISYHSDCGTFNDDTNYKYMTVSEEQRAAINAMLGVE